jgi:hypothetical protein
LGFFSDAVFAVIITIMVLELKPPPEQATFGALLPLWPIALSYVVSYYFIAIVWLNHHHLLRFCQHASPRLIWIEFHTPVHGVASSFLNSVDRGFEIGSGSCIRLWGSLCTCKCRVYTIRVARISLGASGGGLAPDATIRKNALVIHIGDLLYCDAGFTEVSFAGFWADLLRFTGLSAPRASGPGQ